MPKHSAHGFIHYVGLEEAQKILRRNAPAVPRIEVVALGLAYGRVLANDVVSAIDIPARDSAHMDGFAVRSADLSIASQDNPLKLRVTKGAALGTKPKTAVRRGEAQTILTGGFMPDGADAVVQVETTQRAGRSAVFSKPAPPGQFVYGRGRDVRKGQTVIRKARVLRASDQVLLGSLHRDVVEVFERPRVAIIPTGSELTDEIRHTPPGRVAETHGLFLSRLVDAAGGIPVSMPIVPDDASEIAESIGAALRVADVVLTLAGSSVSDTDLTETAINGLGKPGVLVHGMKVHRGRVMGFGVLNRKAIVILPGPIQGAANAFAVMAYPQMRALLGLGFQPPPTISARLGNDWDAGERYRDFTKHVYVKLASVERGLVADASVGETEKVTFLTQNDGYIQVPGDIVRLKAGEKVAVSCLPGLSPSLPDLILP